MDRLFELVKQLKATETRTEEIDGEIIQYASDHYVEIASLSGMLEEMYEREAETGQAVTDPATLDVLRNAFARAVRICDDYVKNHPDDRRMDEITSILKEGSEALSGYNPVLGLRLADIFDPGKKNLRTKAENLNTAKILGTALSARIPAEINGKKGFFTVENETDQVSSFLKKTADELEPEQEYLRDLILAMDNDKGRNELAYETGQPTISYDISKAYKGRTDRETLRAKAEEAVRDFFKKSGVPDTTVNEALKNEKFFRDFDEVVIMAASDEIRGPSLNKALGDISVGSNIERRNVAVSRTADALGLSDIIAYSTTATAEVNGKQVKGVFMENANAVDTYKFTKNIATTENAPDIDFNEAEIIKQASDIQALDYICGGTDRHDLNIMVRYDEENKKVTGIVGIDNDMSFGNMDPEGHDLGRRFMAGPDNMLLMRRSTADRIMGMQKDTFASSMKGLIRDDEMESAWKRVERLQDKIVESIRSEGDLSDPERGKNLKEGISGGRLRLLADDDPLWERTSIKKLAAQAGNSSLFAQINRSGIFNNNPRTNDLLDCRLNTAEIRLGVKTKASGLDMYHPEEIMRLYRNRKTGLTERDVIMGSRFFDLEMENLIGRETFNSPEYKKFGITDITDCIYCDGKPIREVLEKEYGSKNLLPPGDPGKSRLRAHIAMLATSGRHQLSLANVQRDKEGKLYVNVSDISVDLKPLDKFKGFFGASRSSRAAKIASRSEKTREKRFKDIAKQIEDKVLRNTGEPLNPEIKPAENKSVKQSENTGRQKAPESKVIRRTSIKELQKKEKPLENHNDPSKKTRIRRSKSMSSLQGVKEIRMKK